MPPKRSRLVVDERQPLAIAAAPTTAASANAPNPSKGVAVVCRDPIVSGVVSVEASETTAATAPVRPFLPASLLTRLPDAAKQLYQQHVIPPEQGTQRERREPQAAKEGETAATTSSRYVGKREREVEELPASPTGSALEEDVMRQIRRRQKARTTHRTPPPPPPPPLSRDGTADATGAASSLKPSARPLILSNRWSRLRIGAVNHEADGDAKAEASGLDTSSSSESDDEDEREEEEEEGTVDNSPNGSGNATRFAAKSSANGLRRMKGNAFGDDFVTFGANGGGGSASGDDSVESTASSTSDGDDEGEEEGGSDGGALYDGVDEGDDGFSRALGLDDGLPAEKPRMIEVDPALERRIRSRRIAHERREREREAKLRKQFNRHMAGYDEESLHQQENALLLSTSESEEEEEESTEVGEEEGDDTEEEPPAGRLRNPSGGGFGVATRFAHGARQRPQEERPEQQQEEAAEEEKEPTWNAKDFAFPESAPLAHRQRFGAIFFETHVSRCAAGPATSEPSSYPCHHTLLCLRGPITIEGPCGLIGFGIGEASVGGFFLGKKQLVLWSKEEKAVLMPVTKLKTKTSELMELPNMSRARRAVLAASFASAHVPAADPLHAASDVEALLSSLPPSVTTSTVDEAHAVDEEDEEEEEGAEEETHDVEAVFGEIDWAWVQATVKTWRELFKEKLPTMLLVVQPLSVGASHGGRGARLFHNPMRKHFLHSAKAQRRMRKRQLLQTQREKAGRRRAAEEEADDGSHWLQRATEEEVTRLAGRGDGDGLDGGDANGEGGRSPKTQAADADGGGGGGAYVEIPSFISRRSEQNIDLALVPDIVPRTTRLVSCGSTGGAVVVVGSRDIGKSTLCRFLANAYFSQHGLCFWLELDLGQPEFGGPGQLSLYCVRRPLLRAHDAAAVQLVKSFFVGSTTASNPHVVGSALAAMCQFLSAHITRRHPVVVNTHGWVLSTGRRMTVEAVRRLLPAAVVHLVKETEEAWASDTAALLSSSSGLNADVVGNRFLVRCFSAQSKAEVATATSQKGGGGGNSHKGRRSSARGASEEGPLLLLSHLPRADSGPNGGGGAPTTAWDGTVYTVRVSREAHALRLRAERRTRKGAVGRQQLWQSYFAPLIQYYESDPGSRERQAPSTTLLRAPLHCLASVVVADEDERLNIRGRCGHSADAAPSVSLAKLAATLEHRVVAVQIACRGAQQKRRLPSSPLSATSSPPPLPLALDGLPGGFEVSCFGYVESTEREMLLSPSHGQIAIRVPLRPSVVERLLAFGEPRVSIAVSPGMVQDTHFMELYP